MVPRWSAGASSIALGVGIAASAVLGPLGLEAIKFRLSDHLINQFIGGEVVSLAILAPAAIAAGVLWLRDHRLAPALALGPAMYAVYTYTTVIVGQEYGRYAGNVERFFPLYAALVAGGVAIATRAWSQLAASDVPMPSDRLRKALAGIFLAIGGLVGLAWAQQIRLVMTGDPSADYREGPTLFWVIKLLDVGFVIPLLLATGVGLLRKRPVAVRVAYGLAPFVTCLAASIAGMAIAMEATGDPSSQPAMIAVLLPAVASLALATVRLLRTGSTPVEPAGASRRRDAAYYAGRWGSHA